MTLLSLREEMPETARFIDGLREAFGKESIDGQIRAGMNGSPVFYARENGIEIGTPLVKHEKITWHPITGCAIAVEE